MLNFRRLLVWFPLVALTLFFAACGWRNWHLSSSEDEVWMSIPGYHWPAPPSMKMPKAIGGVISIVGEPPPFVVGQTTVLGRWKNAYPKSEPIPASLLLRLQQRYSQLRLRNWSNSYHDNQRYFSFGSLHFNSKFSATCSVIFSSRAPGMAQFGTSTGTLTLTRSPSPFRDTQWHVTTWRLKSYSMG